jgi:glycosyltransferase involved in cell wall biosynthesis
MRVLHVHGGNLYGGVETLLVTLVRHQEVCPATRHEFALCFDGRFRDELVAASTTVIPLGPVRLHRPWTVMRARRELRRVLARTPPDVVVVHSQWSHAIFAPVVRARRLPLLAWVHDTRDAGRHWLGRLARRWPPDFAVCNSRFTMDGLNGLHPGVDRAVVYAPVVPVTARECTIDRASARRDMGLPADLTVIIQVGRVEACKGHLLHLEALARLRDLPGWVSWQVGGVQRRRERPYFEQVQAAAARLGIADRVEFFGWRSESDLSRLLAAADIYCQPNVDPDSFGISFVEALYAGLPAVATDLGGPREIIDESCGMLVPRDPDALAGALRSLILEPERRQRLARAAPTRARALCDPITQIRKLDDILTRLTSSPVSPVARP